VKTTSYRVPGTVPANGRVPFSSRRFFFFFTLLEDSRLSLFFSALWSSRQAAVAFPLSRKTACFLFSSPVLVVLFLRPVRATPSLTRTEV